MEKKEDHDLLIGMLKDISWIKKAMSNHLKHHFIITMSLLSALLGLITYMVVK